MRSLFCMTMLLMAAGTALADEGMWTFDNFPAAKMRAKYGWAPDAAWLKHAQLRSIRLAQGCSASLVSSDGLVMTNHHCARECLSDLADAQARLYRQRLLCRDGGGRRNARRWRRTSWSDITDVTHADGGGDRRKIRPRVSRGGAGGKGANRKRVRHRGGRALPGGDAVPGRRLRSVQIQALSGFARGVRARGEHRILRRRPGQFHLSRATIWTPPSCASTTTASRCTRTII